MSTKELEEKALEIRKEMASLEEAKNRYFDLSTQAYKLEKEIRLTTNSKQLFKLILATGYIEPTYPAMGHELEDGYAHFDSQGQAEDLIAALRKNNNYYIYGYVLKWSGEGKYKVEPTYHYDHDGEIIFTATFIKE